MNWVLLILSGCIELIFTFCLGKVSKTVGVEKGLWCLGTASAIALSLFIVTKVLRTLPIGTAYAVWTGIGASCTFLLGVIIFHDAFSLMRAFGILLIIAGVILLKIGH